LKFAKEYQMDIENLLVTYAREKAVIRPGVNFELEIRLGGKITADMFRGCVIAARMKAAPEFTRTLELIRDIGAKEKHIKAGKYVGGKITGYSLSSKKSIGTVDADLDRSQFRLSLAREEPIKTFSDTPSGLFVRIKSRASFTIGEWRYDMTAVRSGAWTGIAPSLGQIIPEFFGRADSAFETTPADSYEIELEHVGGGDLSRADILAAVSAVSNMIRPGHKIDAKYQTELDWLARYLGSHAGRRFKGICNQVEALTKSKYFDTIYPPEGYYLTEKAEGVRAIASIHDGKGVIITSGDIKIVDANAAPGGVTICDCEYMGDSLYIFDCMYYRDEDLTRDSFEKRYERMEDAASVLRTVWPQTYCKRFERLSTATLEEQFKAVYERKYSYEIDGLILTAPGEGYSATKSYKWKPMSQNTIDFLAIKCPNNISREPYVKRAGKTLYLLFVGIEHVAREQLGLGLMADYAAVIPENAPYKTPRYYPIQFSPSHNRLAYLWYVDDSANDFNGQIVELRRGQDDEWELVRVRDDRTQEQFGFNSFKVAEMTYVNYIDPFDFESLYAAGGSYFAGLASDQYRAGNNYRRFVITQLVMKWFSRATWVIDMAAGRGADLQRFGEAGVKNILCMDIDATGIAELTRRKYEISEKLSRGRKIGGGVLGPSSRVMPFTSAGVDKMSVFTSVQDLTASFEECVDAATRHGEVPGSIDAAACMFAFHYFCRDTDTIARVLTFVSHMLKPGGVFVFTTMEGDRIFKLFSGGSRSLRKGGGIMRWELKEPGQETLGAKYAIERRFDSNNLTAAGQTIAVKLPFSDEMRPEPLANIRHIIDAAKVAGMKLVEQGNFADYMDAAAGAPFYDKLTENDKTYIALHTYVVLRKKIK